MCRQHKDILTELLDKRLSPGRGQLGSCVRRNVLTFFLSEVFSQAWPESIITQVKESLVLIYVWLLSSQKEFYLQLPQKTSWSTLIFWYIIVSRRSTKVKEFFLFCKIFKYCVRGDFPGSPEVTTPHFHCREHEFNPWLGNQDPAWGEVKKKRRRNRKFIELNQSKNMTYQLKKYMVKVTNWKQNCQN